MMMTNDCGEALDQDGHDSSREDAAGFDGQQQTGNRFDTDTENHLVCVPDERGEKMIKNYRWPKSSSVEFETWRRQPRGIGSLYAVCNRRRWAREGPGARKKCHV